MNLRRLQTILLILVLFSSCTPYKSIPYFQDVKRDSILTETINNFTQLKLQPGDLLALHVTSLNHDADAPFNYNLERPNGNTAAVTDRVDENVVVGYLLDHEGNIHLPLVGMLKLTGLTIPQATIAVETALSEVLSKPTVTLKVANFKVSVLGDVARPGSFISPTERFTITDALASAGDLNSTGIRNNVLLIRELEGKRQYIPLDLTSKNIFSSPYYYLKNNDILYVQPNREKVLASDSYFQKLSLLLSALTIVVVYLSR
jgi:polysaccharide export outer membrane protein